VIDDGVKRQMRRNEQLKLDTSVNRFRKSIYFLSLNRIRQYFFHFPVTSAFLLTLLLIPSIGILCLKDYLPFNSADGDKNFSRLMIRMNLLQSFEGDSQRAPPRLWNERLGIKLAKDLWRHQGRGIWWKAWADDGGAYLIVPAIIWPNKVNVRVASKRLGDFVVVGSDALHRRLLIQGLEQQPDQLSVSTSDLLRHCKSALEAGPAVMWRPAALASISKSIAPILQFARFGCISLRSDQNQLSWQGVVGRLSLASAPAYLNSKPSNNRTSTYNLSASRDDESLLLKLQAENVDLLIGGLLSKPVIVNSLETNYGLQLDSRQRIAAAPLSLKMSKEPKGSFMASLQMKLKLPKGPSKWQSAINTITQRLEERGYKKGVDLANKNNHNIDEDISGLTIWRQPGDEAVIGGWAWQQQNSLPTSLSIALGAAPNPTSISSHFLSPVHGEVLRFTADPAELNRLGLLDGLWPTLVKQAGGISVNLHSLHGSKSKTHHWWWMHGQLRLEPASLR